MMQRTANLKNYWKTKPSLKERLFLSQSYMKSYSIALKNTWLFYVSKYLQILTNLLKDVHLQRTFYLTEASHFTLIRWLIMEASKFSSITTLKNRCTFQLQMLMDQSKNRFSPLSIISLTYSLFIHLSVKNIKIILQKRSQL